MNQYYQILSSCRVPGPKQDSVINFKTKTSSAHITVVHNYQVGGPHASPPCCCRTVGGRAQSLLPQHVCLGAPRNRHALDVTTGCPVRPRPQGGYEGPWACPAWGERFKDILSCLPPLA